MLEFLVDNIFVVFAGKVFQKTVGIPIGTNFVLLLADIFLYLSDAEVIQSLLSTGKKQLPSRFNLTYRYIDDVWLSINNPEVENYLDQMYPAEVEIKDTTESITSASYLDLLLSIGRDGQLHTSIYDKRDDFNFHITNFPFLSSNIQSSLTYGVFISELIRYARLLVWMFYSEGPSGHLVSSPWWGLPYAPIVETSFTELAVTFLDLSPWIPSVFSRFCFQNQ